MTVQLRSTLHRDGTITYWSVYRQVWIHRAPGISDRELAAMSEAERARVQQHLEKGRD